MFQFTIIFIILFMEETDMIIKIDELIRLDEFKNIRLISGSKGLWRQVDSIGWLDYEFVKSQSNRQYYSKFNKGQLVMTSFLYAKDNVFLTRDAIRHLIDRDVSGLIVNNVFRIDIPETVLRYADAKEFPIFVTEDPSADLCSLTIKLHDYIKDIERAEFGDKEIGALLNTPIPREEVKTSAMRMNPSFLPQITAIYCHKESFLSDEEYVKQVTKYQKSEIYDRHNSLYRYQNGFMYIISSEDLESGFGNNYINQAIDSIVGDSSEYSIGIGEKHYDIRELDHAMQEAIYASIINRKKEDIFTAYHDLGSYQAILPLAEDPAMVSYAERLLEPVIEYDASYNTMLLNTLLDYVLLEGDLHRLATDMNQHENTLRYRFNQIGKITGLNPIRSGDYEKLALAAKILICKNNM